MPQSGSSKLSVSNQWIKASQQDTGQTEVRGCFTDFKATDRDEMKEQRIQAPAEISKAAKEL